jgi:uncharacterized membrane protein YbhN (UPF0104 family)
LALGNGGTRWRSRIWNISKTTLALCLAGFIISQVSLGDLDALWRHISVPWLLGVFFAFGAVVWVTARRYWVLLGQRLAFRELLALVVLQTVTGNLIATSAGAASYVVGLRAEHQVRVSHSLASLLLARLGDLICLIIFLSVSSAVLWPGIGTLHWVIVSILALLVGLLLLIVLTMVFRQRLTTVIDRFLHALHLDRLAYLQRASQALAALAEQDLGRLRGLFLPILAYSFLILILMCFFFYASIQLFAVPVNIWTCVFVVSLTQLMTLVPVQVFGGLGVTDVTTMYLLGILGVSHPELAPLVIGMRLVFYAANLLLLLYLPLDLLLGRSHGRELPAG